MTHDERLALAEIERLLTRRVPTHREIAEWLGVSHGTVQNIERRAIAKLQRPVRDGWRP